MQGFSFQSISRCNECPCFSFSPHKQEKSNTSTNGHCTGDSELNQEQTSTVQIDQSAEPNTNMPNECPDGQTSTWRNSPASMTAAQIMLIMCILEYSWPSIISATDAGDSLAGCNRQALMYGAVMGLCRSESENRLSIYNAILCLVTRLDQRQILVSPGTRMKRKTCARSRWIIQIPGFQTGWIHWWPPEQL